MKNSSSERKTKTHKIARNWNFIKYKSIQISANAFLNSSDVEVDEMGWIQGWGQVQYLYLVLDAKSLSTWYLLVLEGKVLDTCPSTFKYFWQINMYIQA